MTDFLLEGRAISRHYRMKQGLFGGTVTVRAVDQVTLRLTRGQTLGLVGESGSGKSTTGRLLLGMETPDEGEVFYDGKLMPQNGSLDWRHLRRSIQMVFQDPLGALDRRMTLRDQVREPLDIHKIGTEPEREARVDELLASVGLSRQQGERYPGELSGGQRQRAVIARALATRPNLLVCDEPVSALDVSIQAQVVNLLSDLQRDLNLTMLFVSHDLRVVRQVCDDVAVMYLGRIVEQGPADKLFAEPLHPYTKALVSAAPALGVKKSERVLLKGDPPNPAARPSGCAFHPRCPAATGQCHESVPASKMIGADRMVACHLVSPSDTPRPLLIEANAP
jgi:peptide/nickel transport system ATP-binding protein